jgi:holo-[acyl-carrier protein] synthase
VILGVGVDVVETARVERASGRHGGRFVARVFTEAEAAYCRGMKRAAEHLAARFAAKEAAAKALGTGFGRGFGLRDIEVERDASGRPALRLHRGARALAERLGVGRVHVSLSHSRDLAAAVVVLEGGPDGR